GQTVVWGRHPAGCKYRRVVKAKPAEIEFSEIHWPEGWTRQQPNSNAAALEATHGAPYSIAKNGKLTLNTSFFAAKFAAERRTLWHPGEQQFFQYNATSGLWRLVTKDAIKQQFATDLKAFADETGLREILNWRTNRTLNDLTELLKGHVENADAFAGDRHL